MTDHAPQAVPEITLGWRLRIAMEHASIKADDMAAQLGVHRGTITRWTHDIGAAPRPVYLEKWASLCGVSLDWLAGESPFVLTAGRRSPSIARSRNQSSRGCMTMTRRAASVPGVACVGHAA